MSFGGSPNPNDIQAPRVTEEGMGLTMVPCEAEELGPGLNFKIESTKDVAPLKSLSLTIAESSSN